VLLRIVAEHLSQLWGQQAIVINQPGGAGRWRSVSVAANPPDGHSLYMALASNFIALSELQPISGRRGARLCAIGYVGEHPMVIAASAALGRQHAARADRACQEAQGRTQRRRRNRGSILHLTGEWLRIAGGIDVTLGALSRASQAITDVLGGRCM